MINIADFKIQTYADLDNAILYPNLDGEEKYLLWNTMILCRECNAKKRERPLKELDDYGEFAITAAVRSMIATRGRHGEKDIQFPMDMERNPGFYTFVKTRIAHCQYAPACGTRKLSPQTKARPGH